MVPSPLSTLQVLIRLDLRDPLFDTTEDRREVDILCSTPLFDTAEDRREVDILLPLPWDEMEFLWSGREEVVDILRRLSAELTCYCYCYYDVIINYYYYYCYIIHSPLEVAC